MTTPREALASVTAEVARADAKAGALLAALALPAAILGTVIPGREMPTVTIILVALGAAALLGALLSTLRAIRPSLPRRSNEPAGSWLRWACLDPSGIAADLADEDTVLGNVRRLSRLARAKMRALRLAVDLAVLAMASLTAAAATAALH